MVHVMLMKLLAFLFRSISLLARICMHTCMHMQEDIADISCTPCMHSTVIEHAKHMERTYKINMHAYLMGTKVTRRGTTVEQTVEQIINTHSHTSKHSLLPLRRGTSKRIEARLSLHQALLSIILGLQACVQKARASVICAVIVSIISRAWFCEAGCKDVLVCL